MSYIHIREQIKVNRVFTACEKDQFYLLHTVHMYIYTWYVQRLTNKVDRVTI
jgi:hypothetical protein